MNGKCCCDIFTVPGCQKCFSMYRKISINCIFQPPKFCADSTESSGEGTLQEWVQRRRVYLKPLSPAANGYILRNSPDSAADDFLDLGMFQHDFLKEFNDF